MTEFLEGAVELGDAEVDDAFIDEALQLIRSCGTPASPIATSSRPT